jgi:hypothetical protein
MKRRLDTLTRIGRLQALMHDLVRWRLHSLESQQAGLNDDLKAVFEILTRARSAPAFMPDWLSAASGRCS